MDVASEIGEAVSAWLVIGLVAAAVLVAILALVVKLRDDRRVIQSGLARKPL